MIYVSTMKISVVRYMPEVGLGVRGFLNFYADVFKGSGVPLSVSSH